jgi:hypothetical protein
MRLQTYRDESRSRHFDLTGGGSHPWSIDLVAATAAGILVVGFACAIVALWGSTNRRDFCAQDFSPQPCVYT